MQTITTIGLDIAKSVFQVHGHDGAGQVVIRRQLKRRSVLAFFQKLPPCLVGIEACASAPRAAPAPSKPRAADLGLTERQMQVLALMMQGKSNKAISRVLDLAE